VKDGVAANPRRPTLLFGLRPVGPETGAVESLTSYIMRLAAAHLVTVGHMIMSSLGPLLDRAATQGASLKDRGAYFDRFFYRTDDGALDGIAPAARDWSVGLGQLTGQTALGQLTLAAWAPVLPAWRLIRRTAAYCPTCLIEDQVPYQRLTWALDVVTLCLPHQRRLLIRCGTCGESVRHLSWGGEIDRCSVCGESLASAQASSMAIDSQEVAWQRWVVRSIEAVLVRPPESLPSPSALASALSQCVDIAADGNRARFGRLVGSSKSSVTGWLTGESLPRLEALLRICYVARADLRALLEGRVHPVAVPDESLPPWHTSERRSHDWSAVEARLVESLRGEPMSLRALITQLGVDRGELRARFPDLCDQIAARYSASREERTTARSARLGGLVEATIQSLAMDGRTATRRAVERELPTGVQLREPQLCAAWRRALDDDLAAA